MSKSFDRLQSVLKLEAQQGFKNKAVVGGIRQFVSFWVEQARSEAIDEADAAFIEQTAQALTDYAQTSGNGRRMLVTRLIDKLDERKSKLAVQPAPPMPVPSPPKPVSPAEPDVATEQLNQMEEAINEQIDAQVTASSAETVPEPPPPPVPVDETPAEVPAKPTPPQPPAPPKQDTPKSEADEPDPAGLNQSILKIKGVGPKMAELFEKLNVRTIEELLHLYPAVMTITPQ